MYGTIITREKVLKTEEKYLLDINFSRIEYYWWTIERLQPLLCSSFHDGWSCSNGASLDVPTHYLYILSRQLEAGQDRLLFDHYMLRQLQSTAFVSLLERL